MLLDTGTKAEVDQFGRQVVPQNDVLEFDVPVRHLPKVQVVEGLSQGTDNVLAVIFRGSVVGLVLQVVVEGNPI